MCATASRWYKVWGSNYKACPPSTLRTGPAHLTLPLSVLAVSRQGLANLPRPDLTSSVAQMGPELPVSLHQPPEELYRPASPVTSSSSRSLECEFSNNNISEPEVAQLAGSNMCDLLPPHKTLQDRHSIPSVQAMRKQEQKENIATYPKATK